MPGSSPACIPVGQLACFLRLNFPLFSVRAETNCSLLRLPHERFQDYVAQVVMGICINNDTCIVEIAYTLPALVIGRGMVEQGLGRTQGMASLISLAMHSCGLIVQQTCIKLHRCDSIMLYTCRHSSIIAHLAAIFQVGRQSASTSPMLQIFKFRLVQALRQFRVRFSAVVSA